MVIFPHAEISQNHLSGRFIFFLQAPMGVNRCFMLKHLYCFSENLISKFQNDLLIINKY